MGLFSKQMGLKRTDLPWEARKDASIEVVIEALYYLRVNTVKNTSLLLKAYNLTLPLVIF
jgi:hypothetical protein